MAKCTAKHFVTVNGKLFGPGDEVTGLTNEQWMTLMSDDAIESDIDPAEIVAAEGAELDVDGDKLPADETGVPEDEDGDAEGDEPESGESDAETDADAQDEPEVELPDSAMPDVNGTGDTGGLAASDKPKRAGRGKKADENQTGD